MKQISNNLDKESSAEKKNSVKEKVILALIPFVCYLGGLYFYKGTLSYYQLEIGLAQDAFPIGLLDGYQNFFLALVKLIEVLLKLYNPLLQWGEEQTTGWFVLYLLFAMAIAYISVVATRMTWCLIYRRFENRSAFRINKKFLAFRYFNTDHEFFDELRKSSKSGLFAATLVYALSALPVFIAFVGFVLLAIPLGCYELGSNSSKIEYDEFIKNGCTFVDKPNKASGLRYNRCVTVVSKEGKNIDTGLLVIANDNKVAIFNKENKRVNIIYANKETKLIREFESMPIEKNNKHIMH